MAKHVTASRSAITLIILGMIALPILFTSSAYRRNIELEVAGILGLVPQYEVVLAKCADDPRGLLRGFSIFGGRHQFPAYNDSDAIIFVESIDHDCQRQRLFRLEKTKNRKVYGKLAYSRIEISLDK